MSTWRTVARALHVLGPSTAAEVELHTGGLFHGGEALYRARELGLVEHDGEWRNQRCEWHLTQRGLDWCEGRLAAVQLRPGGRRWFPTWLMALPRDVRVQCGCERCAA